MHSAGLGLVALVTLACAQPAGLWRDQVVFLGDDGTVLVLVSQRQRSGAAEVKGFFGQEGAWRTSVFHTFSIPGDMAHDVSATLDLMSKESGTPARASLRRNGKRVDVTVRLPQRRVNIRASSMTPLGTFADPEGTSTYHAGRAQLWHDDTVQNGWLVSERTPSEIPGQPSVAYGDFVFLVAIARDVGPVLVKHSVTKPAYNQAFVWRENAAYQTGRVMLTRNMLGFEVNLPQINVRLAALVQDSQHSTGVAPDGLPVRYETLLLGGPVSGVAFAIRPQQREL